jgi:hypothetical protein
MSSDLTPQRAIRPRRGSALVLAIIGLFTVALLATVALRMVGGETLVTENMQAGTDATYLADQALSNFFARGLSLQSVTDVAVDETDKPDDESDSEQMFYFTDYSASDLLSSDEVPNARTVVRITPTKLLTSEAGDMYMVEAAVMSEDSRTNRPVTVRTMRTYVTAAPPLSIQAALSAPGGIRAYGDKDNPNRLILKGSKIDKKNRKDACGVGVNVPALATPAGAYNIYNKNLIKTLELEPDTKDNDFAHDSTADTYAEMIDSLDIDWPQLTTTASNFTYSVNSTSAFRSSIPWSTLARKSVWPTILVNGNLDITSSFRGFGMLVVTGDLNVTTGVLKWDGLILVGKKMVVKNGPYTTKAGKKAGDPPEVDKKGADSHTHIKGAVAVGLNCTAAEAVSSPTFPCGVEFGDRLDPLQEAEHLGVEYSGCNVRAATHRLTILRPYAATRHFRLY